MTSATCRLCASCKSVQSNRLDPHRYFSQPTLHPLSDPMRPAIAVGVPTPRPDRSSQLREPPVFNREATFEAKSGDIFCYLD